VPDASTIGRFRQKLVEHDLWEALLGEVNRQLEDKRIIMTEGRIASYNPFNDSNTTILIEVNNARSAKGRALGLTSFDWICSA
jgi:IS5 family transposase